MLIAVTLMCAFCTIGVVALHLRLTALVSRINLLFDVVAPIYEEYESIEEVVVDSVDAPISEFDARIEKFKQELNTPTYPDNVAQTYHKGVYNIPHNTVQDVPVTFEPEYAD